MENLFFWKGEQGAKTLQQINAGIGGATGLSKTEDILLYTAMDRAFDGKNGRKTKAEPMKSISPRSVV